MGGVIVRGRGPSLLDYHVHLGALAAALGREQVRTFAQADRAGAGQALPPSRACQDNFRPDGQRVRHLQAVSRLLRPDRQRLPILFQGMCLKMCNIRQFLACIR